MDSQTQRSPALTRALIVLTVVTGLVDAVGYLGLGHVFMANMTGNVVLLGFAVAGARGFSVEALLASIGSFLLGAVCCGRISLHLGSHRRLLVLAMAMEGVLAGGTAVVAEVAGGRIGSGWPRYTVIVILAFAMGMRNATVRRLAVTDTSTTVLTMTLTGLAADSSLAGGSNLRGARRASAVGAMLLGAIVGAALYLHQGATWPLVVVAATSLATTAVFARSSGSHRLDPATG